jgi:hypothetical protein
VLKVAKLNTKLESEAAEFLVLAALLLERVPAYKTYTNMPGYDVVATNPESGRIARLQVKSRWATGTSSVPIKNFDCDFVVFARLNRGSKDGRAKVKPPELFVFPVRVLRKLPQSKLWKKVKLATIKDWQGYKDRWDLVTTFLAR